MVRFSQGSVLATSLIFLLTLTIIGISAVRTSTFEYQMTTNTADMSHSFQATESALREAEVWIAALNAKPTPVTSCASNPCVIAKQDWYPEDETSSWWLDDTNTAPYTGTGLETVMTQPRFVIEFDTEIEDSLSVGHGASSATTYYRVTARGTGGTDTAQTIIRTIYTRRF